MIDWHRELAIAVRIGVCFAVVLFVAFAVIGFGATVAYVGSRF